MKTRGKMKQLVGDKDLRLWGIRLTLALLIVVMAVASMVSYAQDGGDPVSSQAGTELPEWDADWPETSLHGDPSPEPADRPERAQPPCPECTGSVYQAEVRVESGADLQQLQQMGYAGSEMGTYRLELSGDEVSAMKYAGLDYVVTSWSFDGP